MSDIAIANLQNLWKDLVFKRVGHTIARVPQDVMSIDVQKFHYGDDGKPEMLSNESERRIESGLLSDIPADVRWRTRVSWYHYFGFTVDNFYFNLKGYCELDFDGSLTLDFSSWGNHTSGYSKRPNRGDLIAGEVVSDGYSKGPYFSNWFSVSPELKFLIDTVRAGGTTLTEEEMAAMLITSGFPDKYFAVARLLFYDNVQAFVDTLKSEGQRQIIHPLHGKMYLRKPYLRPQRVSWTDMWLPMDEVEFIHLLSHRLREPRWWQEFLRLTKEQGVEFVHPVHGGFCSACAAEDPLLGYPGTD